MKNTPSSFCSHEGEGQNLSVPTERMTNSTLTTFTQFCIPPCKGMHAHSYRFHVDRRIAHFFNSLIRALVSTHLSYSLLHSILTAPFLLSFSFFSTVFATSILSFPPSFLSSFILDSLTPGLHMVLPLSSVCFHEPARLHH